jgi:hypothetical protein
VLHLACSHAGQRTAPGQSPRSSALQKLPLEATFAELRKQRARVDAAPGAEPFEVEPTVSVDVLVGTERERVAKEIGPHSECDKPDYGDGTECFYDFFHLPDGWVGGGTALFLWFDEAGRCTRAWWGGFK